MSNASARVRRTSVLPQGKTLEQTEFISGCLSEIRAPAKRSFVGNYLHIGNNVMLPEKHIIGIFDLEITSQSKITAAYLKRAEEESVVIDACEDIPKSFLVCDHPYHDQIVYLSQLNSRTLQSRSEENTDK